MLDELKAVLTPPSQPRETENKDSWFGVEKLLNLQLPSDYKEFIDTYGTGCIGQFIIIWNPFANNSYVNFKFKQQEYFEDVAYAMQTYSESDKVKHFPFPLYPKKSGLLPFGASVNGDTFLWRTTGTADSWTIVIDRIRSPEYEVHNLGLSEFLYNMQTKTINSFIYETNFNPSLGFEQDS